MAHRYSLRPRAPRPERLLALYWYQLPDDILRSLHRYAAAAQTHRYMLRSILSIDI